ncbi:MAG TPA: hypothetical protein VFP60_04290 [Pseudolabrys sp.]|nr:hypothetical protein [Pseudolabrys sp.]
MALTLLSIPLILVGVFIKPFQLDDNRCIRLGFAREQPYCFARDSQMPEVIKYGCVLAGFALLYAGRMQLKRRRDRN